jgi:hypothetical protein
MTNTAPMQSQAMPTAPEFRALVAAVRRFILAHYDRLPNTENVTHKWLTEYIVFHAVRGTLAVVRDAYGAVVGVSVAWQMHTRDLLARERAGQDIFDWQPTDPTGDCVYLSLVISTVPGVPPTVAKYFLEFHPKWRELKQFAHRRGRFVCTRQLLNALTKT